jgi:predicted nucleotidyltransferase component of viral defense system
VISLEQLKELARKSGLTVYQQEKDYFLKLFLYSYFKRYEDAIFKGGTCIRYLFGFDRFSEDLDFNLNISPEKFKTQTRKTIKELESIGIESYFIKEEQFEDAYTCEVGFNGPLYRGTAQTRNKIRIDAGKRIGTLKEPEWRLIPSEYPETREQFLVLMMNEEEMLAEKVIALMERRKGRDLYDVWFLLEKGVQFDEELFYKKGASRLDFERFPSEAEYERDLKRLTSRVIPYTQIIRQIKKALQVSRRSL